jgi:protein SCO1/2
MKRGRECIRATLLALLLSVCAAPRSFAGDLPGDSVYQLPALLTTQGDESVPLSHYRGQPLLLTMFYGSCADTCPMVITAMQVYERQLDPARRARLRALMISFDATRDTPSRLRALAQMHRVDPARWTFASAAEPDARKIAALLGFQYRRHANGDYDHSVLIFLLDADGRIRARTGDMFGDQAFVTQLRDATAPVVPAMTR